MKVSLIMCGLSLAYASEALEGITSVNQTLGRDADDKGCISSAGYSWCESQLKCVRNWEESCEDEDDTVTMGNDRDASGCVSSAGYVWCESQSKCLRSWEEDCKSENDTVTVGEDRDESGCISSAGYVWCESQSKCIRSWEESCQDENDPVPIGTDRDDFGCVGSAGYVWCESQSKCLRSWEEDCDEDNEGDSQDDNLTAKEDLTAKITWWVRLLIGPFVCIPVVVIGRRRRRKHLVERNVMIQMLNDSHHNSQVNVAVETIAVNKKVKTSGVEYEAFTDAL